MSEEKEEEKPSQQQQQPQPPLFAPLPKMEAKLQRPSGSEAEREKTAQQLRELEALLDQSYTERGTDTVTCTWQRERGTALVDKPQHKHVTVMGTVGKSKELFPEEVVFLCSLGCARVEVQGQSEGEEEGDERQGKQEPPGGPGACRLAWELSLSAGMRINDYVAYSHLKRLGYVVRRFGTTTPPASPSPPSQAGAISYEVWKPEGKAKFRKTPPDFYLAVCGMNDPFPGADVLGALVKWCQPRELKIAIVSTGDVAFITAGQEI